MLPPARNRDQLFVDAIMVIVIAMCLIAFFAPCFGCVQEGAFTDMVVVHVTVSSNVVDVAVTD